MPTGNPRRILVWHQGALGDVLLSLPALQALAHCHVDARFTLVGNPAPLTLIALSLPVESVASGESRLWTPLFGDTPLPSSLRSFLAGFDLAVVFSPRPRPELLDRFRQAGVPEGLWLCSIPQDAHQPVGRLQAECLASRGITVPAAASPVTLPPAELQEAHAWRLAVREAGGGPVIALAPGSGSPKKNWPLTHFLKLAGRLRETYRAGLAWVLGPAEEGLAATLQRVASPPDVFLTRLPLPALAARLQCCELYVGNDSGVTHLAAATGGPAVVAVFGPTDPRVWAPPGEHVRVCRSPHDCAPCSSGRGIPCRDTPCLAEVTVAEVMRTVDSLLAVGRG